MTIIHLRDVAQYGVVSDVDPYNIPMNAFSDALNVRFDDGAVERSVVFRGVDTLDGTAPRFCTSFVGPSGEEELIVGYSNGEAAQWVVGGTETDKTPDSFTPSVTQGLWTSCQLGGVLYVNRPDHVPWDWKPGDTEFEVLAEWDSTWRTNILRAYNDALCAFNVTKDGTSYPTMVKTSDLTLYGAVPGDWDETSTTNNATENILAEMRGDIVEAQSLQSSMIIYTNKETWLMQADGSTQVYSYRRLFNDAGAMSANCAIELEGKHYVFGYKDIWVHDGVGKESLCNSRVRSKVFTNLDYSLSYISFVLANETLGEIYFCYHDGASAQFPGVEGCNKAAVYNYKNNTWSFLSLPNVFYGANMVIGNPRTYETTDLPYDDISASYFNVSEASKSSPLMVGDVSEGFSLVEKLYGLDLAGLRSLLAFEVDTNATLNWYLEKDGLDLDELNLDLRGYKNIVAIYPQARLEDSEQLIEFSFGSSDYFGSDPSFSEYMSYNNGAYYKLDYKEGGRYLSMKAQGTNGGVQGFRLSGLDIDVEVTGEI